MKFSKYRNDYFMKLKRKLQKQKISFFLSQLELFSSTLIDMQKLNFRVHLVLNLDNFTCPTCTKEP